MVPLNLSKIVVVKDGNAWVPIQMLWSHSVGWIPWSSKSRHPSKKEAIRTAFFWAIEKNWNYSI